MTITADTFTNYATSTVQGGVGGSGSALNTSDTSLLLPTGDGSKFPSVAPFMIQLGSASPWELAKCTARSGDTLTLVRGQEGTTAATWAYGTAVEQVATAGNLTNLWSAINRGRVFDVLDYGAKVDGTTDDTSAIQSAITAAQNAGGGVVRLGAGKSITSTPLAVSVAGITIEGCGQWASTLQPASGFSGAAVITVTSANGFEARDFGIVGANGTYSSNPVCDGIDVTTTYVPKLTNLYIAFMNGWGCQVATSSTGDGYSPVLEGVFTTRCKGGIHIQGFVGHTSIGATLTNCAGDQAQALEAILLEDAVDVQLANCGGYSIASGVASLHIKGGGFIYCTTGDFGASNAATGPCFLLENSANTSLGAVALIGNSLQKGSVGLQINSGGNIIVEGNHVYYNYGDGIKVSGGNEVLIKGNIFIGNNQAANATAYDLEVLLNYPCLVEGNMFFSAQGTSTAGHVTAAINAPGTQSYVLANIFAGANGANTFASTPTVARGNVGYNPVGGLTAPGIPASGVAYTNAFGVDATVYVSGGTVSAVAVAGVTTGQTAGAFRVAAGATITLTYSAAPTWVWVGE